jgi:hypothetical protein
MLVPPVLTSWAVDYVRDRIFLKTRVLPRTVIRARDSTLAPSWPIRRRGFDRHVYDLLGGPASLSVWSDGRRNEYALIPVVIHFFAHKFIHRIRCSPIVEDRAGAYGMYARMPGILV